MFAARVEGSCYLLCILNMISKAELVPEFQHRRITHPHLQRTFQQLWGILPGTSTGPAAFGLRQAISNHMFSNINRFRDHLTALPILSLQRSEILQMLGKQLQIGRNIYDLACPVQISILYSHRRTLHGSIARLARPQLEGGNSESTAGDRPSDCITSIFPLAHDRPCS